MAENSPVGRPITIRLVGPDGQWRDFKTTDYRRRT
jgi:hypothetical protein